MKTYCGVPELIRLTSGLLAALRSSDLAYGDSLWKLFLVAELIGRGGSCCTLDLPSGVAGTFCPEKKSEKLLVNKPFAS